MDPDADRTKNEEPVLPMAGHHRPLAVAKLGRRVEDTREHAVTWSWRRCCFYYSETLWLLLMLVLGLQQCKRESEDGSTRGSREGDEKEADMGISHVRCTVGSHADNY